MMGRLLASPFGPWAGLFVGALAWALHHQIGSDANNWDCRVANGAFVVGLGVVFAMLDIAGGWMSWSARRIGDEGVRGPRGFGGVVGVTSAGIFLLAIGFQTLAGALVPACLR